jgi:hypothetical protein
VILRCTARLLALLGVKPERLTLVSANDWYANLLWIERRKCILMTHAGTLFSVFAPDVRKADLAPLGGFAVSAIQRALVAEGLPREALGRLDPADVRVAPTASRSILASMNEMARASPMSLPRRELGIATSRRSISSSNASYTAPARVRWVTSSRLMPHADGPTLEAPSPDRRSSTSWSRCSNSSRPVAAGQWSGRRDSNSRHPVWKECARIRMHMWPVAPLERVTSASDERVKLAAAWTACRYQSRRSSHGSRRPPADLGFGRVPPSSATHRRVWAGSLALPLEGMTRSRHGTPHCSSADEPIVIAK